jgi:hypothetical protein
MHIRWTLLLIIVSIASIYAVNVFAVKTGKVKNTKSDRNSEVAQKFLKESPEELIHKDAVLKTAAMHGDAKASELAQKNGLQILNLTWEDTGRYKNSSVGPNISDMTIQVGTKRKDAAGYDLTLMPVIRYPNFSDTTADIDPREFTLLVGNHDRSTLKRISLYDFLQDPTLYLNKPKSWVNPKKSLLAPRDNKVLVSAQACFLPVPPTGKAVFNPVIFNYQSVTGDPAVLTVLATNEGTSTTIIDNKRDRLNEEGWGQRLFHNENGQRASLTGERLSDVTEKKGEKISAQEAKKSSNLNMVLLIQIPLLQKNPPKAGVEQWGEVAAMSAKDGATSAKEESNVEAAVIGHGDFEGPYTEIDNLSIERDPSFPVRVTVQFYKATSNGVVSESDMKQIKEEIDSVYKTGSAVGSLVVAGETGRETEYVGLKIQPPDWWKEFWQRHKKNTGEDSSKAMARLKKLLGEEYQKKPVSELFVRDRLRASKN